MADPTDRPPIELVLPARDRLIDGFSVGRVLPAPHHRMVGPFVFFDHMGPSSLPHGQGLDVRPHPHINLSTVTYLFEGAILHRDSLGTEQLIEPGAINWMTAGRGIVHSERTPIAARAGGPHLHGLQLWVALPRADEETEPGFSHHTSSSLPELDEPGVRLRVLAGSAYGARSPVPVYSPLFYVDVQLARGARLTLPDEHEERAIYVIDGDVACAGARLTPRTMAVVAKGAEPVLTAESDARLVLVGGAPFDEPRYIFWNFVSSRKERIEEAARAWRAEEFPLVPGDTAERIPLMETPHFAASGQNA